MTTVPLADLFPTIIPSNLFTYTPPIQTFVVELSDLREYKIGERFMMESTRTGKRVWFHLREIERDNEGEITTRRYFSDRTKGIVYWCFVFND